MNRKRFAVAVLIFVCVVGLYAAVSAEGPEPGSEGDPVVTKSYVDQRVYEIMRLIDGYSPSSQQPLNSDETLALIEYAVKQAVSKEQGASFTPVFVEMDKIIYGGEGCEMILRSGGGYVVTSTDAVVNVTSGRDLRHGADAPAGNLLIFPRDDGRGIKTTNNCWFLVKGQYTIK